MIASEIYILWWSKWRSSESTGNNQKSLGSIPGEAWNFVVVKYDFIWSPEKNRSNEIIITYVEIDHKVQSH